MATLTSPITSPILESKRAIVASEVQEDNCCVNISKKVIVIAVGIILTLGLIALAVCAALFAFPLEAVIVPAVGAGIVAIFTGVYAYVTRSNSSEEASSDDDAASTKAGASGLSDEFGGTPSTAVPTSDKA
jgi:hypothetical protein